MQPVVELKQSSVSIHCDIETYHSTYSTQCES